MSKEHAPSFDAGHSASEKFKAELENMQYFDELLDGAEPGSDRYEEAKAYDDYLKNAQGRSEEDVYEQALEQPDAVDRAIEAGNPGVRFMKGLAEQIAALRNQEINPDRADRDVQALKDKEDAFEARLADYEASDDADPSVVERLMEIATTEAAVEIEEKQEAVPAGAERAEIVGRLTRKDFADMRSTISPEEMAKIYADAGGDLSLRTDELFNIAWSKGWRPAEAAPAAPTGTEAPESASPAPEASPAAPVEGDPAPAARPAVSNAPAANAAEGVVSPADANSTTVIPTGSSAEQNPPRIAPSRNETTATAAEPTEHTAETDAALWNKLATEDPEELKRIIKAAYAARGETEEPRDLSEYDKDQGADILRFWRESQKKPRETLDSMDSEAMENERKAQERREKQANRSIRGLFNRIKTGFGNKEPREKRRRSLGAVARLTDGLKGFFGSPFTDIPEPAKKTKKK